MNYFAHGRRFLDQPWVLAGTAAPDWLSVVDRRVRVRERRALELLNDANPIVASVARGIVWHHRDDAWFHSREAFVELSLQLTVECRQRMAGDDGFRPSFLGHILVELLLDAALIAAAPDSLQRYYRAVANIDAKAVEEAVGRIAGRPAAGLAWFIERFCQERFLWDYSDDSRLLVRINQVLRRVGLRPAPPQLLSLIGQGRRAVTQRARELIEHVPSMPVTAAMAG